LAETFSWFSFDRDFRYGNAFTLPDQLILVRRRLEDLEQAVLGEERDNGLAISDGHNPTFYGAARAWCQGLSIVEITRAIDLSEGDLVMTFNKTIDLMRQVRDMLTSVLPDHPLRESLAAAEKLLRRGIVEQSLTIGFNPIESPEPEIPANLTNAEPAAEEPAPPKKKSRVKKEAAIDDAPKPEKPPRPRKKAAKKSEA
ncbi:MAG: hypothetical protein ACRDHN_04435, partial [Thermomicrobiales bacterium]